jgi:hypothetical protein
MNRNRFLQEVTEKEFEDFRTANPRLEEQTNELRTMYIEKQVRPHLTWNKPRAVKQDGKFFLVRD